MGMLSKVANLTPVPQFGVGGTDLGIAFVMPNGETGYVFGDTFEQHTVGGPGWRSPVLLRGPRGGVRFTSAAGGSYAKQILPYRHDTGEFTTKLPSDAITIGDTAYLQVMVMRSLEHVVSTEIWKSAGDCENWEPTGYEVAGHVNDGMRQVITWERGDDGYVYVFSTKFSRNRGVLLHRVPELRLTDPAAWEPWGWRRETGWQWGNAPTPVLSEHFGELCVRRIEGKWVLVGFNAQRYRIEVRVVDSPTSDLVAAPAESLVEGSSWPLENHRAGKVAQLYGGYIVPGSTLRDFHLIVSQWQTATNWPYRSMHFAGSVGQRVLPPAAPASWRELLAKWLGRSR